MKTQPRRRVLRFDERPNRSTDLDSRRLFPTVATAVLDCGHLKEMGVSDERPARVACWECGLEAEKVEGERLFWANLERKRSLRG